MTLSPYMTKFEDNFFYHQQKKNYGILYLTYILYLCWYSCIGLKYLQSIILLSTRFIGQFSLYFFQIRSINIQFSHYLYKFKSVLGQTRISHGFKKEFICFHSCPKIYKRWEDAINSCNFECSKPWWMEQRGEDLFNVCRSISIRWK